MAPALRPAELCCLLLLLAALPRGAPRTVRLSTDEEAPPGTVLGALGAELAGLAAPGEALRFRLVQPAGAGGEGGRGHNGSLVRLREADGQLSVGEAGLDRERLCGRAPRCLLPLDVLGCGAGAGAPRCRLLHVELEVRDVNDHAPRFPQPQPLALEVSESAAPGTRLPLALPVDEDVGANGVQRFQLSPNAHFGVEVEAQARADGGRGAALVLLRALDREAQAAHALELVAADGGSPARSGTAAVRVRVLDANDNSPAFAQAAVAVELREDAAPGAPVLALSAADPDEGANGEVVYGFGSRAAPEARRLFRLDPRSGRLTLAAPLDYERQRAYELDVEARDRGASPLAATCTVLVRLTDVNDNAPGIRLSPLGLGAAGPPGPSLGAGSSPEPGPGPGVLYVSEAAPRDSLVALVSTWDRDSGANGQVRCMLHGHEHFALRRAYGDSYVLVTAAALDRERLPEYNLTLVAEDLGTPPFRTMQPYTVRLRDENDNAPLFTPPPLGRVAVPENNPPGAYLATVLARDPDLGSNGKVTYRLLEAQVAGAPVSTYVSLDPTTGVLRALCTLDYEVLQVLELEVEACDAGTPPQCSQSHVHVHVLDGNDHAPSIVTPPLVNSSAELPLPCHAPPGFLLAHIAAQDADEGPNAELSYSIVAGAHDLFALHEHTGVLWLRRRLWGGEVQAALPLVIMVQDGGWPTLSCTATLQLVPTDVLPSRVEIVVPQLLAEEQSLQPGLDPSMVFIVVLAGGCCLLLAAIIGVVSTCGKGVSGCKGRPREQMRDLEGRRLKGPDPLAGSPCAGHQIDFCQLAVSPRVEHLSDDPSWEDGSRESLCHSTQERKRLIDSQGQVLISSHSSCARQEGLSASSLSAHSTPDQFSVKDSGKGDSEFNDSDSDISGEGLKKTPSQITEKQLGIVACEGGRACKDAEEYCSSYTYQVQESKILPSHNRNGYMIKHFSTPLYQSIPHLQKPSFLSQHPELKECYYPVSISKTERLQSVCEQVLSGNLSSMLSGQYEGLNSPSQNILPLNALEVATSF